jgi:hypothetical protein
LRNILYLTVLPIVHIPKPIFKFPTAVFRQVGSTTLKGGLSDLASAYVTDESADRAEQIFTLFPDKNFATKFFADEVQTYANDFRTVAEKHLRGGHVIGYEFEIELTEDGRYIVRVIQNVQ